MAMEDVTRIKHTTEGLVLRSVPAGKEYPLKGEMLVGRERECAISLSSTHASRYHAKINVSPHGIYIEDLHSTNGTFINGKKTRGRIRLSLGDEITFDDLVFRLTSHGSGAEDATLLTPKPSSPQTQVKQDQSKLQALSQQEVVKPVKNAESNKPAPSEPISADSKLPTPPSPQEEPKERSQNDSKWLPEKISDEAPLSDDNLYEDNTQMMSSTLMDRLSNRNKSDVDIDIGSGPRLIVMTAPLRGKLFELKPELGSGNWQIGRAHQSEICLNDKTISTDHAHLSLTRDGFVLTATHAKNAILINGVAQTRTLLLHNDKVQIGRTELMYRSNDQAQAAPEETSHYEELNDHRFAIISSIATFAVVTIAFLITSK